MCASMSGCAHGVLWTQSDSLDFSRGNHTSLFKWFSPQSCSWRQHISAEAQNLVRFAVIQSKVSEPQVHFFPLFIYVALAFPFVCSRVLQWRLGGQMDMESRLDTTWQRLLWWRQDARLRSFQRWALQLNYIWHCTVTVRTSALHSRCLELLSIFMDCNMHVKMLMRNEVF